MTTTTLTHQRPRLRFRRRGDRCAAPGAPHHQRDGRPVPRWATVAAHVTALVTLPSGLWRVGLAAGLSMGMLDDGAPVHLVGWEAVWVLSISLVAEAAAMLTLGLVRPWGERVPRWLPLIGGRRIPPLPVVVVAGLGAVALQAIWTFASVNGLSSGATGFEFSHDAWMALLIACYLPLLAWAPLLAAVTWAYYRRRMRD